MKKYCVLFLTIFMLFPFVCLVSAHSAWQLYDDFNSGEFDLRKWEIDDSSAVISIENGRAKMVHQAGYPNDSSWIKLTKNPEYVQGIRADVTVESCTGNVQCQLGAFVGNLGGDNIWYYVRIGPYRETAESGVAGLEPGTYAYRYDLFWGNLRKPVDIIGNTYTAGIWFSDQALVYNVEGLGKATRILSQKMTPTSDYFVGVGTRSSTGEGPCTVYIDNVYIYTTKVTPAIQFLLLED